jgi:putative ABC transport system ATP-binding protein
MIELHSVSKRFRRGDAVINAVDSVDVAIEQGEFVALEGPSGSGKTTLLQLIGTLDRPDEGQIFFEGRALHELGDHDLAELRSSAFGFVFQQFNLIPTLTAVENVEAALAPRGVRGAAMSERAHGLLEEVGLSARAGHLPVHLSGGEQQRVAIARALSNEPRVILADEPTGNLDSKTGADVIELLAGLAQRHGTTIVVATHDAGLAARAPRRVAMRDGRIAEAAALTA